MQNKKRRELHKNDLEFIKVKPSKTANSTSITKDLLPPSILRLNNYFSKLSLKDQDILLTLIARCMESGFRRGVTHFQNLIETKDKHPKAETDFTKFRHDYDLDISPEMFHKGVGVSSRKRLDLQYGVQLSELGFNYDLITCDYDQIDPKEFK